MLKTLLIAAASLVISAPVLADHGHRQDRRYGGHAHYQRHHHRPAVVLPPRVIYRPAPVHYTPPPRVILFPPLLHGISIRLNFPR
jgi:hypothetical protein